MWRFQQELCGTPPGQRGHGFLHRQPWTSQIPLCSIRSTSPVMRKLRTRERRAPGSQDPALSPVLHNRERGFVLNGRAGVLPSSHLPPATAEKDPVPLPGGPKLGQPGSPGVRSELALSPAHPPRSHGEVGWGMTGVLNVCVRERRPPATGSSYPSLGKITRDFLRRKGCLGGKRGAGRKEKQKRKQTRWCLGVSRKVEVRPQPHPPPKEGALFCPDSHQSLCKRSQSFWGQHRTVLISAPGLEDRVGCTYRRLEGPWAAE